MVGLASLSEAVLGRTTTIDGLVVSPTTPTSLAVNVGVGSIYAAASLDAQAYGSLPADTAHSIVKQGVQLDPLRVPITVPGTPGYSQTFLLQAAFQEVDAGAVVLPFYNSANPSQAWAGPSNSGSQQYTERNGRVVVQVKAGAPAPTGSQPTPQPDPNWVGLAWVTVASGQAVILQQHITYFPGPHRIARKLPALGRIAGSAVTTVTANRNLTLDEAGLIVLDLGAWSDDITVRLPPINTAPGEPLRFTFIGRYITPRSRRALSWARIIPSGSDGFDASFYYCGPNDTLEVMSDGVGRWSMVRGSSGNIVIGNAAGAQTIPNGVSTAISFSPLPATVAPEWFNAAAPTRLTPRNFGRYRVSAGVSFVAGGAGVREMKAVLNGNSGIAPLPWLLVGAAPSVSTILTAAGGPIGLFDTEYVELYVLQNSGAPLAIDPTRTFLSIEALSA